MARGTVHRGGLSIIVGPATARDFLTCLTSLVVCLLDVIPNTLEFFPIVFYTLPINEERPIIKAVLAERSKLVYATLRERAPAKAKQPI
jgi:hypothetical protein